MHDSVVVQKLDQIFRLCKEQLKHLHHLDRLLTRTYDQTTRHSSDTSDGPPFVISPQGSPIADPSNVYRDFLSGTVQMVGFAAAILGLVTGYVALIPRIVVSQSQPLDVGDPFSTPFIVANDGPLPMMNVTFSCAIGDLKDAKGDHVVGNTTTYEGEVTTPQMVSNEISPGERATVPCPSPFKFPEPLASGDIAIVTRFRIGYTPFRSKVIRRFRTSRAADGHIYWFAQPVPQSALK